MNNKNNRLLFILKWVYNPRKKRPTIKDLWEALKEEELSASLRTLERDMSYLKYKNLVVFNDEKGGYDIPSDSNLQEMYLFVKLLEGAVES